MVHCKSNKNCKWFAVVFKAINYEFVGSQLQDLSISFLNLMLLNQKQETIERFKHMFPTRKLGNRTI